MTVKLSKSILFLFTLLLPTALLSQRVKYKLIKTEHVTGSVKLWYFDSHPEIPPNPKVVVTNNKIEWIGTTFKPLTSGYVKTIFSPGGKYLGMETSKEKTAEKIFQLEIFSNTGKALFKINRPQYYDEPYPVVIISDKDGSVVLGQSAAGKLCFYNQTGTIISEVDLFVDDKFALERTFQLAVSSDGNNLTVLANKRPASLTGAGVPEPSGEPHLFLFTLNGKKLWQHPLPELNAGQVAISPAAKYLIASSYTADVNGKVNKSTLLFDSKGNQIANYDFLFRNAYFSADLKYLLLTANSIVKCVNLPLAMVKWSFEFPRSQGMITAAGIAHQGEHAIILLAQNEYRKGAFIYTNPRLIILDDSGRKIQEIKIPGETFFTPALSFTPDYNYIAIGFKDSYQIYQAELLK